MRIFLTVFAVLCSASSLAWTQQRDQAAMKQMLQQRLVEVKQNLARNQEALKQYTWVETIEVSMKGEVKSRKQSNCRYGPDGKVQKEQVSGGGGEQPQGRKPRGIKGRRRQKKMQQKQQQKMAEMKEHMDRVMSLTSRYVPPNPPKMQAAFEAGNASISRSPQAGTVTLTVRNYIKEGDSLSLVFDTVAKGVRSINVGSYLEGPEDVVTLAVKYVSPPNGPSYIGETLLDAKAKKIGVRITNFGHQRMAQ